ncbi:Dimer-Tnp-hAT domain-containing protein [Mycena indigotica]|uniref:Dimer-Tnp-hAT domain-containing protein n=1 Tax=Mycena indigotica TaxID=2126181 RepID=A0A8H6S476_9AGAR|nr:Dimer-Tnp-hAT domain-containing protein [Mycena indigotica]KAF7291900.1 Dimer-Tnp-hAT domain-containing protein [Mycena indigotica]
MSSFGARVSQVASKAASSISRASKSVRKAASRVATSISGGSGKSKSSSSSGERAKSGEGTADIGNENADAKKWTSGVYQFFKPDVKLLIETDGRPYQAFTCGAKKCKGKGDFKGVKRYQTRLDGKPSGDRSSTSGLKKHARACWGKLLVDERLSGTSASGPRDGNIFTSFAKASTRPIRASHRTHTEPEFRAHIVRWLAEAARPLRTIEDRELKELLGAGRPELTVPSRFTVARDLQAAYERCATRIANLLENYPGRLSFATDAWTSPNHLFLIDIYEVPESHSGETLAREFNEMLQRFNLSNKILAWTGDNATSNDTQNDALSNNLNNAFEAVNRQRRGQSIIQHGEP